VNSLLYGSLALLAASSALGVILVRRPVQAWLALGLNTLSLAGIAWTLTAPLVAIVWMLVGLGMVLTALVVFGRDWRADDELDAPRAASATSSQLGVFMLGVILLVGLASAILAGDAPGRPVGGGEALVGSQATISLLVELFARYGLCVVGVGLGALATLIGFYGGEG